MRQRNLVVLLGAAIAAALFLPWTTLPDLVGQISPWSLLQELPGIRDRDPAALLQEPLTLQLFMASFVLGALAALLAVLGWAPRLLAFLAGLVPIGLAAYVWFEARDTLTQFGPALPGDAVGDIADWLLANAGIGFWLWAGGAVLMLLTALLDPGDSD